MTTTTYIWGTLAYSFANGAGFAAFAGMVLEMVSEGAAVTTKYSLFVAASNFAISYTTALDGHASEFRGIGTRASIAADGIITFAGISLVVLIFALFLRKKPRSPPPPREPRVPCPFHCGSRHVPGGFRADFERLNRYWIEKDFRIEGSDLESFRDPHGMFVAPGGEVFFALVDGKALGTCALRRADGDTYELCKMAVAPEARGRDLGDALMRAALATARERGARRMYLVTNSALGPALGLYRKHGFVITRSGPRWRRRRATRAPTWRWSSTCEAMKKRRAPRGGRGAGC